MSRKFLLIDQSVKDFGGHHAEYALRVLEAARLSGYETLMGVSKFAELEEIDGVRVFRCFRFTFWENMSSLGLIKSVRSKIGFFSEFMAFYSRMRDKFLLNVRYTRFGLGLLRAREISFPFDEKYNFYNQNLGAIKTSPFLLIAAWLINKIYKISSEGRLLACYRRVMPHFLHIFLKKTIYYFTKFILFVFYFLAFFLFVIFFPFVVVYLWVKILNSNKRNIFCSNLEICLAKAKLSAGDVVFVPTLGDTELLAIADLCKKDSLARSLKWRLLFRRNLYKGWPASYKFQNDHDDVRRMRLSLNASKVDFAHVDVNFFTDTEPLTLQYNRLGLVEFATCCVPVSKDYLELVGRNVSSQTCFGYFGDARHEKGFFLIPAAIDYIQKYDFSFQPKFLIQSNFNIPGGDSTSGKSKLELQTFPETWVELIEGPFDSQMYKDLFGRVNATLILYDASNYSARSSGVFIESVIAARTPIVSANSWMAGLLEPYRQAYLKKIESTFLDLGESSKSFLTIKDKPKSFFNITEKYFAVPKSMEQIYLQFCVDETLDYEFVKIHFKAHTSSEKEETISWVESVQLCAKHLRLLVNIPKNTVKISFYFSAVSPEIRVNFMSLDARFVPKAQKKPVSVAGLICEETPMSVGEAMSEYALHQEHYMSFSKILSQQWAEFFLSDSLVRQLDGNEDMKIDWFLLSDLALHKFFKRGSL